MERPPKKYVCEKCGYLGDTPDHEGCDYLAWTTGEQLYIDHLERELALLKASPASVPAGWKHSCNALCMDAVELWIPQCPHCGKPAPATLVSEDRKDAELLDYIQNHGATIQIVPMANRTFGFEVGGLHKSRKLSVREAIDAAMQEDKP